MHPKDSLWFLKPGVEAGGLVKRTWLQRNYTPFLTTWSNQRPQNKSQWVYELLEENSETHKQIRSQEQMAGVVQAVYARLAVLMVAVSTPAGHKAAIAATGKERCWGHGPV